MNGARASSFPILTGRCGCRRKFPPPVIAGRRRRAPPPETGKLLTSPPKGPAAPARPARAGRGERFRDSFAVFSDFNGLRCRKFHIASPRVEFVNCNCPRRRGESWGGAAPAAQEFGPARSRDSGPVRPICTGRSRRAGRSRGFRASRR